MRHLVGGICLAIETALLGAALRRARGAPRGVGAPGGPSNTSLAAFGEIMRQLVFCALGYAGIKSVFLFFAFGAQQWLSLLDLVGFLALLAAYGAWFHACVRYREPSGARQRAAVRSAWSG